MYFCHHSRYTITYPTELDNVNTSNFLPLTIFLLIFLEKHVPKISSNFFLLHKLHDISWDCQPPKLWCLEISQTYWKSIWSLVCSLEKIPGTRSLSNKPNVSPRFLHQPWFHWRWIHRSGSRHFAQPVAHCTPARWGGGTIECPPMYDILHTIRNIYYLYIRYINIHTHIISQFITCQDNISKCSKWHYHSCLKSAVTTVPVKKPSI